MARGMIDRPYTQPIFEMEKQDMLRGSSLSTLIMGLMVAALCVVPDVREARAQTGADAALRDRVLQLVDRLDTEKVEARETATASLIKLGPKILSLLPDAATVT